MNSFIPWVGGKSQLRKQIIAAFPNVAPKSYIEVFGGAGWVLFGRERHAPLEVLNDFDGNLINLYRCIQNHSGELERELRKGAPVLLNSREMFFDYQEQMNMRGLTDIQRAARYYYIIRASYGADRRTYVCTRRPLDSSIEHLAEVQQRLCNVVIENRDFADVLRCYNRPQALFYLDPPYYKAEAYYEGFAADDHVRLREALAEVKGWFVLSYNDTPEIRDLYKGYTIHEVERSNNLAHKKGAGQDRYRELIITNY